VKFTKNIEKPSFAACKNGARLIKISIRAAVRPTVSGVDSRFPFSAGCQVRISPTSDSKKPTNLTRREFFRGKNLRRQTQIKHYLEN
jgi:hypothetical protein